MTAPILDDLVRESLALPEDSVRRKLAERVRELEGQLAERRVVVPEPPLEESGFRWGTPGSYPHQKALAWGSGWKAGWNACSKTYHLLPATEVVVKRERLEALENLLAVADLWRRESAQLDGIQSLVNAIMLARSTNAGGEE